MRMERTSQVSWKSKQWCEDVRYKMQDRWESLAALWPLGSPPAALPIPGNQGTPPWSRLNYAVHPEPRELLVWWEGTGREREG